MTRVALRAIATRNNAVVLVSLPLLAVHGITGWAIDRLLGKEELT